MTQVPRSSPLSYGDGCITEDPSGPSFPILRNRNHDAAVSSETGQGVRNDLTTCQPSRGPRVSRPSLCTLHASLCIYIPPSSSSYGTNTNAVNNQGQCRSPGGPTFGQVESLFSHLRFISEGLELRMIRTCWVLWS